MIKTDGRQPTKANLSTVYQPSISKVSPVRQLVRLEGAKYGLFVIMGPMGQRWYKTNHKAAVFGANNKTNNVSNCEHYQCGNYKLVSTIKVIFVITT